ncbi:MAG: aspartyl protease family protein [Candidatus Curtissbacteria bacterium]
MDSRKKSFAVPWIPVSIRANDTEKKFLMLVDSGADFCILDKDIAKFLGINIYDGAKIKTGGIGNAAYIYYFDNIYINVGGEEVKVRCGFKDGYLANGMIAGVLGRQGFFEHFKVTIDEKSGEIELKAFS